MDAETRSVLSDVLAVLARLAWGQPDLVPALDRLHAALAAEPADAERDCAEGNRWCGEHDCGHTICPTCGEVTTGEVPAPPAATGSCPSCTGVTLLGRCPDGCRCGCHSHPPAATGEGCVRCGAARRATDFPPWCERCRGEWTGRAPRGSDESA